MRMRLRTKRAAATVVDAIDDPEWNALSNDEQRFIYIIERRQLRRSTPEQYLEDLEAWREGMRLYFEIRRQKE
jgi:hypothetical protein